MFPHLWSLTIYHQILWILPLFPNRIYVFPPLLPSSYPKPPLSLLTWTFGTISQLFLLCWLFSSIHSHCSSQSDLGGKKSQIIFSHLKPLRCLPNAPWKEVQNNGADLQASSQVSHYFSVIHYIIYCSPVPRSACTSERPWKQNCPGLSSTSRVWFVWSGARPGFWDLTTLQMILMWMTFENHGYRHTEPFFSSFKSAKLSPASGPSPFRYLHPHLFSWLLYMLPAPV